MKNIIQKSKEEELQLLKNCETNAHTDIAGKQRFLNLMPLLNKINTPKLILDVGGTLGTAKWLKIKFPQAKITILNNSKKEISSFPNNLIGNAENFKTERKYDLIFAGEIVEHLINTDGFIASSLLALKKMVI